MRNAGASNFKGKNMQLDSHDLHFTKKKLYIISGILLGLICFFIFRSCSLNHVFEETYTIGENTEWKNLHLNGKVRNLVAFNHELLTTLSEEEDFHLKLIPSSKPLEDLRKGKLDGILTSLPPNSFNGKLAYSDPYFLSGPILITSSQPKKNGGQSIIGVPEHSPLLSALEQDPSIEVRIYDDILDALADLREKRIDGAIFPALIAYTYTEAFYDQELKIATSPLTDEGIRLATLNDKKGQAFIKAFNEGLKKLKENGTYREILERWGFIDIENIPHQSSK